MKKISYEKLLKASQKVSEEWRKFAASPFIEPGPECHKAINQLDKLFPGKTASQLCNE